MERRGKQGERRSRPPRPVRRGGDGAAVSPSAETLHLSDEIVRELKTMARPGKGDILVKVFAEAAGAFSVDDYDEAIRLGEQSKHIALRSPTVRELLGLAYYRAGKWQEAARELSAFRRLAGTIEQNPVIADCYRAIGKPDKALALCDEVGPNAAAPVYYEAAIVAAGALADMGRVDEGIARLEALDLDPQAAEEHHLRAWYALGNVLEKKGRFTQARQWFEAVASVDPDVTDAPDRIRRIDGGRR